MALDKTKLKTDLKTLFDAAFKNNYAQDKIAEELANLIDGYVKSADITGVEVNVTKNGAPVGTGTQTNTVKLT